MTDQERIEIIINQIAQEILSINQGENWFILQSTDEQKKILDVLCYSVYQSHPRDIERKYAVLESGLKSTFTPCVLLLYNAEIRLQLKKICKLPQHEYKKSFRLLITLLAISDSRRREQCAGLCDHWWHKDLSCYKML